MKRKLTIFFFILGLVSFLFWVFAQNESLNPPPVIDFAPNFWFDSEEKYYPTSPLDFYYDENLQEIPGEEVVAKYNNLSLEEKLNHFKVFYEIKDKGEEWVYEYWLFYVFNDFTNEHYGDWEPVFVFVDKNTKKVNRVIGSAHWGSKTKIILANNELSNPESNHVAFLIEKGSHASYPDGNNDGLVNPREDITNWYNSYAFLIGFREHTQEDKLYGLKIYYTDPNYKLEAFSQLQEKLKGKESLNKSPELGISVFKIGGQEIYLPLGGEAVSLNTIEPIVNEPERARAITLEFLTEKTQAFVKNTTETIQNNMSTVLEGIGPVLNQINPFGAAIAPVSVEQKVPIPEKEIIKEEPQKELPEVKPQIIEEKIIETEFPKTEPELTQKERLAQIQEQLDDITERIDVLSQEVTKLAASQTAASTITPEIKAVTTEKPKELTEVEPKTEIKPQEISQPTQKITQKTSSPGGYSTSYSPPAKILISEVQIEGNEKSYDFIELYNPNSHDVELKNYRLVKRAKTSANDTTIKSWSREPETKIPAKKHYLWASNEDGYHLQINADTSTSLTLADNNGIAIRYGDENTGQIIDALGWGDFNNFLFEGTVFPKDQEPGKNQSLERKKENNNFIDTNNNSQDFQIQINPNPTNSSGQTTYYDSIPPETNLDQNSLPQNPTISTQASFIFTSNEDGSTFECSLDGQDWQNCQSPKNYSDLTIGSHQFQVRAIDPAGNIDQTPASYQWTIENPLPQVTISRTPDSQIITSLNFTLNWSSPSPNIDHYDVQMKIGDGSWQDWLMNTQETSKNFTANKDYTIYYFLVRAVDTQGNVGNWVEISAPVTLKPIVINEIMYDPFPGSDDYCEYLELFNTSPVDIDLAGWKLISNDEQILSADVLHNGSSTVIKSGGYAIIGDKTEGEEHIYDYNTCQYNIPSYSDSAIRLQIDDASLGLNNQGMALILKNSSGEIIDEVSYQPSWGGGGNLGKSLERVKPYAPSNQMDPLNYANWKEGPVGGTPNTPNSNLDLTLPTYIPADYQISQDTIWSIKASPYHLMSNLGQSPTVLIGATLIIEPGVILKPLSPYYTAVKIQGTLKAIGEAGNPIKFTSSQENPQIGDFATAIEFLKESQNSILDYTIFEYGGYINQHLILIFGTNIQIKNSIFRHTERYPIYMSGSSQVFFSGNKIENSFLNGICVKVDELSDEITQEITWSADLPYVLGMNLWTAFTIAESGTLILEPGTVIKFMPTLVSPLKIKGKLIAEGSEQNPIVFTSFQDDDYGGDTNNDGPPPPDGLGLPPKPWDWRNILIEASATASLEWLKIRYGGWNNNQPLVIQEGANVTQENVTIEFSSNP